MDIITAAKFNLSTDSKKFLKMCELAKTSLTYNGKLVQTATSSGIMLNYELLEDNSDVIVGIVNALVSFNIPEYEMYMIKLRDINRELEQILS